MLKDLSDQLMVSRATIYDIILGSGRLNEARFNPAQFKDQVRRSIQASLAHTLTSKDGIHYFREIEGEGQKYDAHLFVDRISGAYDSNLVKVSKSIYNHVPCDSQIERDFATGLDALDGVKLFIKLPSWFKVPTPIGNYNPDWAIVMSDPAGEDELYLVRETKGSNDIHTLRFDGEKWKVVFGAKHFESLGVDYKQVKDVASLNKQLELNLVDDATSGKAD